MKLLTLNEVINSPSFLTLNKTGRFSFSSGAIEKLGIVTGNKIKFFFDSKNLKKIYIRVDPDGDVEIKNHTMRVNKKDGLSYKYTYFRSVALMKIFKKEFKTDSVRLNISDQESVNDMLLFPLLIDQL